MRIEKARPEKEIVSVFLSLSQQHVRSFGDPCVVMIFLRDEPFPFLSIVASRGRAEVVTPVCAALLLKPQRIMLADMGLVRVIAR